MEPNLLERCRQTLPQSSLLPSQRIRNLRGAMAVRRGYDLSGMQVVLVDDVMTTGITCSTAAKVLKDAGVAHVTVAVLARSGAT